MAAAAVLAMAIGMSTWVGEDPPAAELDVRGLVAESHRLESVLRTVGEQPRVVNGITAAAIADLEDRIELIDAGIAAAQERRYPVTEIRDLWEQRVSLMGALVNTHVRQVGYVGF